VSAAKPFAQYIQYWNERQHLKADDWRHMYQLTHAFLASCAVRSFEQTLGTRKELIDDFFHDKVFMGAGSAAQAPYSAGALCQYFKNYLVDKTRNAWDNHRVSAEDVEAEYENCGCVQDQDAHEVLAEFGLPLQKVEQSARQFLATQDVSERMYLALHACADDPEALSNLAKRFRVPSYHYKAKKLGITREKGQTEAGYEKTQIGAWLADSLGLPLHPDAHDVILAALKILCFVSLSEWEATTP
jgi:hypothetical protein